MLLSTTISTSIHFFLNCAGTIQVLFTGTGYTAASSEKVEVLAASFPAAWTLYNFFIVTPSVPRLKEVFSAIVNGAA